MSPPVIAPISAGARAVYALLLVAALAILAGCAQAGLGTRVRADAAQGDEGTSVLRAGEPLAAQAVNVGPDGGAAAGSAADADHRAAAQAARPVLRRARASWIGAVSVPAGSGERLPTLFTEPVRLNFDDAASGGKVSLRTVADRITAVTGVPVRLKADVFPAADPAARGTPAGAAPGSVPMPMPMPLPATVAVPLPSFASPSSSASSSGALAAALPSPAGAPVNPAIGRETSVNAVAMRWSGSLQGYLDLVADQLNLCWEYRDGAIVIERLRTEFLEVATLENETDYHLGLSGADQANATSAGGGSGGTTSSANASNEVVEHGRSNVLASLLAAISQLLKDVPGASVVRSDGSGRLAVTATRDSLAKVREFVRAENESLLRQAQVQFDIYSVTRDESDERGIEWDAVVSALGGAYTATLGAPSTLASSSAANLGFAILTPARSGVSTSLTEHLGGSSALLKLLSAYGVSTQHREVSLLALNRTWDRKSSLGGRAYVSATVPGAASTAGVGAPGLVTSTVTTGDRYLAQPYILDNDTVLLKFGIGLSSLVSLVNFTSGTGSAQQTVQTPETTAVNDQATVALKAGQILVITGLSRWVASDVRRTLTEDAPVGLGGSRSQSRMREDFVILVRPTIL